MVDRMRENLSQSMQVKRKPTDPDYLWTTHDQPHRYRKDEILKAHPEVRDLYGYDPMTKWAVTAMVLAQVAACWFVQDKSWTVMLLLAYGFGGVINHALTLAIHEITHGLAFAKFEHNQWFAMFANTPLCIAYAINFRKYHFDHHTFQGIPGKDVDIPTYFEGSYFSTVVKKLFWIFMFPLHYAIRPLIIRPKAFTVEDAQNWTMQLAFDAFIVYFFGWYALLYLLVCTFLGLGAHPVAGHFIAEHYVFHHAMKQETYSYYGPLNYFTYNVGYHNEHHDFPRIPASRLPILREIAAEFYEPLPYHTSWLKVLWDFVFQDVHRTDGKGNRMYPVTRVARKTTFGLKRGDRLVNYGKSQ